MRIYKSSKVIEVFVIIIYLVSVSIVSYYHEPWFDEAQAWLIARDNNLFYMIWNVLRYEGHTPLWYIFLYIPSHLGVPYELGLKSINISFMTLAVILIVKKSPFPMYIRLILPFTYFFFYQYGVISRSYSLLCFVMLLVSIYFNSRNVKPFWFILILAILGGVSVHGILIAFGISLAWFIEICKCNKSINNTSFSIIKDKRFFALVMLGFINVLYMLILWPKSDKFTPLQSNEIDILNILFKMFAAPLNSVMLDVWPTTLGKWPISVYLAVTIGIILFIFFIFWANKKQISLYMILPYTLTTLFMSSIYFSKHHSGIYLFLLIFIYWIATSSTEQAKEQKKITIKKENFALLKPVKIICLLIIFCVQLFWTLFASLNDITLPYSESRAIAAFIKSNNIEGKNILNCISSRNDKAPFLLVDISSQPYFTKNIFYNLNFGDPDKSYITHKQFNSKVVLKYLDSKDSPDFIIDRNSLSYFSEVIDLKDYIIVEIFDANYMWKEQISNESRKLLIRKDLISKYPNLNNFITIESSD